ISVKPTSMMILPCWSSNRKRRSRDTRSESEDLRNLGRHPNGKEWINSQSRPHGLVLKATCHVLEALQFKFRFLGTLCGPLQFRIFGWASHTAGCGGKSPFVSAQ